MIINGEFWVCVFAILSGYLLNKKDIRNGADLIKICINRYFRFVIPFFFANFFVYLLYNFVGFSAQKCGMIVNNQWLLNQYTNAIDFISVVKNSLIVAIGLLLFPYTFFIGATYIGSLLAEVSKNLKSVYHRGKIIIIYFVVMLGLMSGIQNIVAELLKIQWLHINQYWEIFYAMSMLVCISSENQLLKWFDNWHIDKFANQSMIIYLLHWPIICSFSTWCLVELMGRFHNFSVYYWSTLGATIIVLGITVYCYDKVFGRVSNTFLRTITFR